MYALEAIIFEFGQPNDVVNIFCSNGATIYLVFSPQYVNIVFSPQYMNIICLAMKVTFLSKENHICFTVFTFQRQTMENFTLFINKIVFFFVGS